MSATTPPSLDLQEQINRIDRMMAETQKLQEEAIKLRREAMKLDAEALKLGRDRLLAPVLAVTGMVTGIAGVAVAIVTLIYRGAGH